MKNDQSQKLNTFSAMAILRLANILEKQNIKSITTADIKAIATGIMAQGKKT